MIARPSSSVQNILNPSLSSRVRSRFNLPLKTTTAVRSHKEQEQTQSPLDFAWDVLVEPMKSAVEISKRADGERAT